MVSIKTFGKPCSGAKTLGWEYSIGYLENIFENLGIEPYSNEMFSEMRFWINEVGWKTRSWWILRKRHWWFFVVVRNN
jgi:hypothetical protein